MERSLLTLGGKNLNLIEYIYFGEEKYAPVSQNGSTIVFRVPTLPETRTVRNEGNYLIRRLRGDSHEELVQCQSGNRNT